MNWRNPVKQTAMKVTDMSKTTARGVHEPRTLEEIEAILREPPEDAGSMKCVLIRISASLAAQIDEQWNEGNRPMNDIHVQQYRRDMTTENWLRDGEIGFGAIPGSLMALGNGQHRFRAQVLSGTTQQYLARVFFDADEYAKYVMTVDGGRNRTMADVYRIFNIVDATGASQAMDRIVNAMQNFSDQRPSKQSKTERLEFALKHVKGVRYALGLPRREFKAHLLAAVAYAFEKEPKSVEEFVASVVSGADLKPTSAALALKNSLPHLNGATGPKDKDRAAGLMARAIFDGCSGRRTTIAKAPRTSCLPAIAHFLSKTAATAWARRQGIKE